MKFLVCKRKDKDWIIRKDDKIIVALEDIDDITLNYAIITFNSAIKRNKRYYEYGYENRDENRIICNL